MIAVGLVVQYAVYVKRTLAAGERFEGSALDSLHPTGLLTEGDRPFPASGPRFVPVDEPPVWMVALRTVLAFAVIIAGAHLFVTQVEVIPTDVLDVPAAVVALSLAPLATELPETFNSVIRVSEGRARSRSGTSPAGWCSRGRCRRRSASCSRHGGLGLAWGIPGFLNTLSAVLALVGGGLVLLRGRLLDSNRMRPVPFLLAGLLYAVFIATGVYHVVVLGVAAAGH